MKSRKSVTVALTGGLGNQLFQLAAALYYANGSDVRILENQGNPRRNHLGNPELFSFSLPANVKVVSGGYFKWFSSKIIGFNLRAGISPKSWEKRFLPLIHFVSSVTLFLLTGKFWSVAVSDNVGFPSSLNLKGNSLLIGYFQTDRFIERISIDNFVGSVKTLHPDVEKFRKLSYSEWPLIIHVRLGDYRGEASIGVLSKNYYLTNYQLLMHTGNYRKIWLFSDEPDQAIDMFNSNQLRYVRVIDSKNLSSAETLEIMTFGKGYLIANSTFGWWGAYLSKTANAEVVAPSPWFRNLPEPRYLIPEKWNRAVGFDEVQ